MRFFVVSLLFLCLAAPVVLGSSDPETTVKMICQRTYIEGTTDQEWQAEVAQIDALGEPGRKALARLSLSKGREGDRAMGFLQALDARRALVGARELLGEEKATVDQKQRALRVVATAHDAESLDRVLALFRRTEEEDVVREAAKTLAALRMEAGLHAMREALDDPRYQKVRGTLVEVIGVEGNDEAVDPLIKLLDDPVYKQSYARGSLMESLARIGTRRSRAQAVALAKAIDVKSAAGESRVRRLLAILRDQRARSRDSDESTDIDGLIQDLTSSVPGVR